MADTRTQSFVPIEEIRDGIAILRDGSMRAIVMASSINIALKSLEEQEAILKQFQAFLNTLDFSLQMYVQSRRLDINPYLELLTQRESAQTNDLMKVQLREYIGFIKEFTRKKDIMTKSFFMVVPYDPPLVNVKKGIASLLSGRDTTQKKASTGDDTFAENRTQLEQRIGIIEQGLRGIGIRTVVLNTDQVVDLFYHIFNPYEGKKAAPPQQ